MTDWFSYNWELHGEPARFLVDQQYAERFDVLGDFITLLHVTALPPDARGDSFTPRERKRLDAVLKLCIDLLGQQAVYVGCIDTDVQRRFYFYTSDARLLVPLYDLCAKETVLQITCAKADELNRQTYFRLLYADAAKRQSAANDAFIASMAARGDDLAAFRRVNLRLYFPSYPALERFAAEAKRAGLAMGATDFVPERELPHAVTMHAVSALDWASVTRLTTEAIRIAEDCGGVFDSFDSAFIPKRGKRR